MNKILETLGQNPKRSMHFFLKGVVLFCIGLAFVALGYYQQYWWQTLGLVFIAIGCGFSIFGYVGIFANRLITIFNKHQRH